MKKTKRFTLRVSPEEKEMFTELAQRLKRTQSCAVVYVIRELLELWKKEDGAGGFGSPEMVQPS